MGGYAADAEIAKLELRKEQSEDFSEINELNNRISDLDGTMCDCHGYLCEVCDDF